MTITRKIGDTETRITLTAQEMYDAYFEMSHNFDCEDVQSLIDEMTDDQLLDEYGVTAEKANELVPRIADVMREYMDNYGAEMFYAREYAMDTVFAAYREEEADRHGFEDDSDRTCADCPLEECTGHCMSCHYR